MFLFCQFKKRLCFWIVCFACAVSLKGQDVEAGAVEALPLPNVPSTLREPMARANYIVGHFWDAMEWGDTLRSHQRNFMEQNFSNYISVFPYAEEAVRAEAVEDLLKKVEEDEGAYRLLADVADHYLYDVSSPVYNEEYYILFAEKVSQSALMGDAERLRIAQRLEMAKKNRPNTKATDFSFITREGKRSALHKTKVENFLLLVFYDPECDHCKEVMNELKGSPLLMVKMKEGTAAVLAVYADGDKELWEETADLLPKEWTVAFGSNDIVEKGLYSLRVMPTMYLLDSQHRVVLKDPSLAALLDYLRKQ